MGRENGKVGKGLVPVPSALNGYVPQSGANPGFEAVPWTPRRELTGTDNQPGKEQGVGKYCPRHLHFLTDDEKDPKHYPLARVGADGEPDRFCWCCGRPLTEDGLSAKAHKGYGKPCPSCGFRRKQKTTQRQLAAQRQNFESSKSNKGVGRPRVPRVSEVMSNRVHEEVEKVLRPYFEALDLRPKKDWSPSTTVEFFVEQVSIAEKLLDRVEGKPVNRNRHVTADDEDVLRADELSPATFAKLVAAMATGADTEAILGEAEEEAEDAEFEVVE